MKESVHIEQSGSGGDVILYIHGNSGSVGQFNDQLQSNDGLFRQIAFDLPGCGLSFRSESPEENYSFVALKNVTLDFVQKLDYNRLMMVGHSLGGHIALEISAQVEKLMGLLIFGTPPLKEPLNIEEAFLPFPTMGHFFSDGLDDIETEEFVESLVVNNEVEYQIKYDFQNTDPNFRVTLGKALSEPNQVKNEVSILNQIENPVFVVHGLQDPLVNLEYIKSLNSITKFYEIEQCGHYPHLEQPVEFSKIIKEVSNEVFI